jgi:hypothetical protein
MGISHQVCSIAMKKWPYQGHLMDKCCLKERVLQTIENYDVTHKYLFTE